MVPWDRVEGRSNGPLKQLGVWCTLLHNPDAFFDLICPFYHLWLHILSYLAVMYYIEAFQYSPLVNRCVHIHFNSLVSSHTRSPWAFSISRSSFGHIPWTCHGYSSSFDKFLLIAYASHRHTMFSAHMTRPMSIWPVLLPILLVACSSAILAAANQVSALY